ncbi:hypothetical protein [Microbulbifer sp. TYP-18]|uniref:hypothetical protein n=1 Tax=Microbulbifer sp. TYP-18 TaxID=3230024 RepID=UPI0034C6B401
MSKFEMDDVDLDGLGKSEDEINEILESGDEDAIEELLGFGDESSEAETPDDGQEGDKGSDDQDETASEEEGDSDAGKQGDNDGTSPDADQPGEQPTDSEGDGGSGDGERYVESRNGQHKIPYAVLQNARERASALHNRTEELQQNLSGTQAELAQLKSVNDQLKQQLQANNLTPADVLQKIDIDDEMLETLSEYGNLGEVVRALALQNQQLQEAISQDREKAAPPVPDQGPDAVQQQVESAIANNPSLSDWRQNDPDKWEMAIIVDEKLKQDPAFKEASFEERFKEVVKRTQAAFGVPDKPQDEPGQDAQALADKAKAKVEEATKNQFPQSLTDIGHSSTAEKSRLDQFSEMSEAELAVAMENMSQDQIESLMAELGE